MVGDVDTPGAQATDKKVLEPDASVIATDGNHIFVILCSSLADFPATIKKIAGRGERVHDPAI